MRRLILVRAVSCWRYAVSLKTCELCRAEKCWCYFREALRSIPRINPNSPPRSTRATSPTWLSTLWMRVVWLADCPAGARASIPVIPRATSRTTSPIQARIMESLDCCWRLFLTQPNPIHKGPVAAAQARARAEAVGPLAAPEERDLREEPAERELPAEQEQVQAPAPDAALAGQPAPEQQPRQGPPIQVLTISIRRTTSRAPSFRRSRRQPPPISKSWRCWLKAPADSPSSTPTIFSVVCNASAKSKANFI